MNVTCSRCRWRYHCLLALLWTCTLGVVFVSGESLETHAHTSTSHQQTATAESGALRPGVILNGRYELVSFLSTTKARSLSGVDSEGDDLVETGKQPHIPKLDLGGGASRVPKQHLDEVKRAHPVIPKLSLGGGGAPIVPKLNLDGSPGGVKVPPLGGVKVPPIGGLEAKQQLFPSSSGVVSMGTTLVGKYEAVNSLGTGSFGSVWKARDLEGGHREVAVKIIRDTTTKTLDDATREYKIGKYLHDNGVRYSSGIFDKQYDEHSETLYLVMDLAGRDFQRQPPQTELALKKLVLGIVKALKELQNLPEPVIHHDLKALNVGRWPDDAENEDEGYTRVKLLDWGTGIRVNPETNDELYKGRMWTFTTPFADPSPPLYEDNGDIDQDHMFGNDWGYEPTSPWRYDVFSLGIMIHDNLFGVPNMWKPHLSGDITQIQKREFFCKNELSPGDIAGYLRKVYLFNEFNYSSGWYQLIAHMVTCGRDRFSLDKIREFLISEVDAPDRRLTREGSSKGLPAWKTIDTREKVRSYSVIEETVPSTKLRESEPSTPRNKNLHAPEVITKDNMFWDDFFRAEH
eukprot:GFYU01005777.1.p1 GENE.GFYU01005777.1~~GFYU01005777.1.p1  ORF type:complete len:585 (-),score=126.27 GFYU01005777.1:61-1779(-)